MFVSVTRLHIKGPHDLPAFSWHTIRSITQSRKAKGLLYSSFLREGWDTYWTLTIWENEECMKQYRNQGNHLRAMAISRRIADALESVHWESEQRPTWRECQERLHRKYGR